MSNRNTEDKGNKRYGRKDKFRLPFTETINDGDFITLKRDQTTEGLWIRYEDLKEDILGDVVIPDVEPAVSFMIDYNTTVETLAVWFAGNYENRVSTEGTSVEATATTKWHLSRLDINGSNLDLANVSESLWDWIINAVEGTTVLVKVYNREDKSQYVYLKASGDTFVKANASIDVPPYYDLEFEADILKSSNITGGTISNPTVAIIIGRPLDAVRNRTDTYASIPKQEYAVTLTSAEYAAMGEGRPSTTLYMVPCDGSSAIIYVEDLTDVEFGGTVADGDIFQYSSALGKWTNVDTIVKSVPTYADNAAAISGGLSVNTWYKTATGELRIVV